MTPAQIICLTLLLTGELTSKQADELFRRIRLMEITDEMCPSEIKNGVAWLIANVKEVFPA